MLGLGLGVAAVFAVQQHLLPPRLSAAASAELQRQLVAADAERQGLRTSLADARQRLQAALVQKQAGAEELSSSLATTARLHQDLTALVTALPPDPRGGAVAVRAGRFMVSGSELQYNLVLTRERAAGKPMPGMLQLRVAGESEAGVQSVVTAKAVPLLLGSHAVLHGSLPLPVGFKPRQTTIQVFDQPAGKAVGMRVLAVP